METKAEIWNNASEIAKKRYLAFSGDEEFDPTDSWIDQYELRDQLKYLDKQYYLEDRSADEGIWCGAHGTDSEDEAIDYLLEAYSKYGQWYAYKWDEEKNKWLEGSLKRKGKEIQIIWKAQ
jgi:hypothetical protein